MGVGVPGWICRLLIWKPPDVFKAVHRNSSPSHCEEFPLFLDHILLLSTFPPPQGPWGKGTTVQSKEHWAWNQEIRFKSQHRVLIHHVVLGKLPGFAVLMGPRATNAFFLVEHHMTLRAGSSALRLNCDHTAPPLEGPNL